MNDNILNDYPGIPYHINMENITNRKYYWCPIVLRQLLQFKEIGGVMKCFGGTYELSKKLSTKEEWKRIILYHLYKVVFSILMNKLITGFNELHFIT